MDKDNLISADDFCRHYHTEITFIQNLSELGLIEVTHLEQSVYIDKEQLQKLEQFTRMHYDLNINEEGIEAIHHLLSRVHDMQNEITALRNKLRLLNS